MDITMTLRVEASETTDPAKLVKAVEQYVRDMLYVGVDADSDDPFWVTDLQLGHQISPLTSGV